MEKSTTITITPELPIGTEFWFMHKNRIELGLVAAYDVRVTSCTDENRSWHEQLFSRWMSERKQKEHWKYTFNYEAKIDTDIPKYSLHKQLKQWYLYDRKIYFTKEECAESLK